MITYLNSFAENWMAYFGTSILQNTLFLGVIFLVLYLLRERDARTRYAIAALGLIKLLVPPFVPLAINFATNTNPAVSEIGIGDISVVTTDVTPAAPALSVPGILLLIWITTILIMIGSTLTSTLKLKWHLRNATFVKYAEIDGKAIFVFCSPNISVPMSVGLFPNRVYVPLLWSSLTDDLQHSLLRHEVAHIKRKDGLFGVLQMLARAIYFFHPLVWILTRQADELREMACDDMAVDHSEVTPLVYSRCLVHVAEHMLPSWSCSSASTLMKQKNKLYSRVNYQVKETNMKKLSKHKSRLIWTLLLVLIVPLSWYCKQEADSPLPPPVEQSIDAPPPPPANYSKIYGTVTDSKTGKGIPGANIILNGTNQGAATDLKGNFVISNVLPGDYFLECSIIGYRPQRFRLKAENGISTRMDFKMQESVIYSDKVTVTANQSEKVEKKDVEFTAYDEPPTPIGGGVAIANNLVYPEEAKKRGIEGMVIIKAFINKDGVVDNTLILKSELPEVCNEAAQKAISDTKFEPAKQRGTPVGVWISIPIQFRLDDK